MGSSATASVCTHTSFHQTEAKHRKCKNLSDVFQRFPTLEMVSGMLKSFPPCSLKPQGPGPGSDTM